MAQVVIALGSNISPEVHLPAAVAKLAELSNLEVLKYSSVWESEPVGFREQANFCNGALLVETTIAPQSLKMELRSIEDDLGRKRDPSNKNGPRTIDLDIGLYGDLMENSSELTIPDPEIESRPFLAIPFAEVAPEMTHPTLQICLRQLADRWVEKSSLIIREDIVLMGKNPEKAFGEQGLCD